MPKNEKILGYALLILGLILLLFSIFAMINVYYGNTKAPALFELQDISLPIGQTGSDISLIEGTQVSLIANLFFWSILMGFVMISGCRIAQLGVTMIKDIQVQIKETITTPQETKTN
jgi:hypothetical protein